MTTNVTPPSDPTGKKPAEKKAPAENKSSKNFTDSLKNIKKEDVVHYAKNNTIETIAYALLIIGIIMLLFAPYAGQVLVGAVAGYFFGSELIDYIQNIRSFVDEEPIVRSLVLGGLAIALFIGSPLLFIALFVVAGIKYLFYRKST